MTEDLVVFLRARLDQDRAEIERDDRHWSEVPYEACSANRLLAEVDAKRRILNEHRAAQPGWCVTCDIPGDTRGNLHGCQTVRLLALPYGEHPDYQPDWAPNA